MSTRNEVFTIARERVANLFQGLTGNVERAVGDMTARGVSAEGLADTNKVRGIVLSGWKYVLNRNAELECRGKSRRWVDFFEIFALIMGELNEQAPTPREFVDTIADHLDWSEEERASLSSYIESNVVTTAQVEKVESPVEKVEKKVPKKRAPSSKATAKTPASRIKVSPMSVNDGRGDTPIVSGDLDYRVTSTAQIEDEDFIAENITAEDPHARQLVRDVGGYVVEKVVTDLEAGLKDHDVKITGKGISRGAAVTAALIVALDLDEHGSIELSPAMEIAVEVLRERRDLRLGDRVAQVVQESRETKARVEELGVAMAKLLESSEVNGRLSTMVVVDRAGLQSIPLTEDAQDIEVLDSKVQEVYNQAQADVRERIRSEIDSQWRSRKGATAR